MFVRKKKARFWLQKKAQPTIQKKKKESNPPTQNPCSNT